MMPTRGQCCSRGSPQPVGAQVCTRSDDSRGECSTHYMQSAGRGLWDPGGSTLHLVWGGDWRCPRKAKQPLEMARETLDRPELWAWERAHLSRKRAGYKRASLGLKGHTDEPGKGVWVLGRKASHASHQDIESFVIFSWLFAELKFLISPKSFLSSPSPSLENFLLYVLLKVLWF